MNMVGVTCTGMWIAYAKFILYGYSWLRQKYDRNVRLMNKQNGSLGANNTRVIIQPPP